MGGRGVYDEGLGLYQEFRWIHGKTLSGISLDSVQRIESKGGDGGGCGVGMVETEVGGEMVMVEKVVVEEVMVEVMELG